MARQRQGVTTHKVWSPPAHEMSRLGVTHADETQNNIKALMNRVLPKNRLLKEIRTALHNRRR
jgi:hypothetical protein